MRTPIGPAAMRTEALRQEFRDKTITAQEAAALVKSGDIV